jgi:hypothetical protein
MARKKKETTVKDLAEIPAEAVVDAKPERLKQTEIPGTERPSIPELDEQAEEYVRLREQMQFAVKQFKEKGKTPLIDMMHANADKLSKTADGSIIYVFDSKEVVLSRTKEVLKVQDRDNTDDDVSVGEAPTDESDGEA